MKIQDIMSICEAFSNSESLIERPSRFAPEFEASLVNGLNVIISYEAEWSDGNDRPRYGRVGILVTGVHGNAQLAIRRRLVRAALGAGLVGRRGWSWASDVAFITLYSAADMRRLRAFFQQVAGKSFARTARNNNGKVTSKW